MSQAIGFCIAIILLFVAMACFFVAFHPGGVDSGQVKNPDDALKWFMDEFNKVDVAPS